MATLPKCVDAPPGDPIGDAGFPYLGNIVRGQPLDLSTATVSISNRIAGTNPPKHMGTQIKLSDLINYIVDTAKGQ